MNRRTLLLGGLAAAGLAAASSETVRTVVLGHVQDGVSRVTPNNTVVSTNITHMGMIRDNDPGQDALHRASGTITVADNKIQLGEDFTSTPGPDYHVYISSTLDIVDEATFEAARPVELGRLKRGNGASVYDLIPLMDAPDNFSVTIWCKRFGEFIGSANVSRL